MLRTVLRMAILALVVVNAILLTHLGTSPAQATSEVNPIYAWEFYRPGSDKLVCKQVAMLPKKFNLPSSSLQQASRLKSKIVSDNYCQNLTKPIQ